MFLDADYFPRIKNNPPNSFWLLSLSSAKFLPRTLKEI